jgi:CheY-like chemotaxis protein
LPLKILIAEDERDIAETYRDILHSRGHRVVIAPNGLECVAEYLSNYHNKENTPYDVVVIDHTMPVMKGAETARRILKVNPKQKIIFISGYGSELLESLEEICSVHFLTKPTSNRALIEYVEN